VHVHPKLPDYPFPILPPWEPYVVLYWLQILVVANGRESSETDISDIRRLIPFFFFWLCRMLACTILVPQPGFEPKSMTVKAQVLTTGLPGNALFHFWIWPMKSIKISDNWTCFQSLFSITFVTSIPQRLSLHLVDYILWYRRFYLCCK